MKNQTLTKDKIISIVSERFESNPRLKALFDINDSHYKTNVKNLINYCYNISERLNGIFVATNQKTIIFYFLKSEYGQSIADLWRYAKVILAIKIRKLWSSLKREQIIKKSRLSLPNYIYVWFLAQEKGYGRIDGLIEIQKFLFAEALEKNLPILLETSNEDVVKLYQRASFTIYNELEIFGEKIYFLHANMDTVAKFCEKQNNKKTSNLVNV